MTVSHRPLRFLVAGVWNTAFGFGIYLLCDAAVRAAGGHYVLALFPAQVLAVANAYLVHRTFVFSDGQSGILAFLRYNLIYWTTFAVNLLFLPVVVETTGLDPRLVQAAFVLGAAVATYVAHRLFSFPKRAEEGG